MGTELTKEEIDAMEALEKEATPGPWINATDSDCNQPPRIRSIEYCPFIGFGEIERANFPNKKHYSNYHNDVPFVVQARTFIPKAIAHIRELENDVYYQSYVNACSKLLELQEQTRWRHIDQEQPEAGIRALVWNIDTVMVWECWKDNEGMLAWYPYNSNGQKIADLKDCPYWQPLPTKGPE